MSNTWFNKFGDQPPSVGGIFFRPGIYIIRIEKTIRRTSQRPETLNHQIFVMEATIHEVEVEYPTDPEGWPSSNSLGARISYIQNPSKHGDMAFSNIKNLMLAALQTDDPSIVDSTYNGEQWRSALVKVTEPPGTALAGKYIRARVGKSRTSKGKPFTPVNFEPVDQAKYSA